MVTIRRRTHRSAALLAALCLCSLATLTACGDGGDGGDASDTETTASTSETAPATATPDEDTSTPTESESDSTEPDEETTEAEDDTIDTIDTTDTGDEGTESDESSSSSDAPHGTWTGNARISVDFEDPGCAASSQTYSLPATLIIDDPAGSESNDFHLSWASDSQSAAGAFGVTSALSGTDTTDGESVETGYWSLTDDGGGDISGSLTDTGGSQGLALNLVFVPKPLFPCSGYTPFAYSMAEGTTLEGTLTEDSASLTLSGTTSDGTRSFRVEWS
ncbi:hypothetical protein [Streptomyces sp. NBC_00306]|uniref:hypothetical protein n=1 Tax=Streptomyces sp. NBC_00306 TaxID=2975708 RepID=UPI002E2DEDBD|nr:hypothetical protein [Streptomyces sp. NBC_00306]